MRKFGLIGYPLGHSFSLNYFTEKFQKEHILDCSYQNFPIPRVEGLTDILSAQPGLEGLNVTIPYKEQVLSFLHDKDEVVEKVGACNCIRIINGHLTGYNTDVVGFEISLKKKLKPTHRQSLVLGTGGAAKAVGYVLKKLGIPYWFVSRGRLEPEAGTLSYSSLSESLVRSCPLIINTTPVGMFPDTAACPDIPYSALTQAHYLYDLVYNPANTTFLQKGAARGAETENGLDMLVLQAEESWRLWNL